MPSLSRETGKWISRHGCWLATAVFVLMISVIYLPTMIFVYGVIGDAEQIYFKVNTFIGHEAWHLARIARPIGALFVNIPLLFLDHLSDFRYGRMFSVLTVILVGCVMIRVLVTRLWIRPVIATIIATGTFCLPGFLFTIMNPTAWSMHLLSLALSVSGYAFLARSHAGSLFLSHSLKALDFVQVWQNYFGPGRRGGVIMALFLFELSMFCYPPNCLMILVFPVATVLFSPLPVRFRESIFLRDVGFVGAGIVLYLAFSKALYFPIGNGLGLLVPIPETGPASMYRFVFDFNFADVMGRLLDSVRVAKDLWFLPNFGGLILTGYAVLAALLVLMGFVKRPIRMTAIWTVLLGTVAVAVCYVLAVAPLIFTLGGLIAYRTIVVPSAIVLVVVLYLVAKVYGSLALRVAPLRAWANSDLPYGLPIAVAIFLTTSYGVCTIVQIGQNELAYVTGAVRDASMRHADGLIFLDGRRMFSSEEIPSNVDIHGHALVPYDPGCYATYCLGLPGLYAVAKEELRLPKNSIDVFIMRNEALKGVTCEALLTDMPRFGDALGWPTKNPWEIKLRDYLAQNPKVECTEYNTKWIDLERHADSSFLKSSPRIDRSIWRVFLPKTM